MPRPVVYLIYNLLLPVFLVIGLPSFLIKGLRRGGLARNFRQRFGIFSSETLDRFRGKKPVWIRTFWALVHTVLIARWHPTKRKAGAARIEGLKLYWHR